MAENRDNTIPSDEEPFDDNDEPKTPSPKHQQQRHLQMLVFSAIIIGVVLWTSGEFGTELFGNVGHGVEPKEEFEEEYLFPFLMNLAGVLLFIMNTARRKQERWELRRYWGDHCFRVAQSVAYLFIVMWAMATVQRQDDPLASNGFNPLGYPPSIIGFLVGFFILRVERAMEGLGDKFEEVLMAVLPRAASYMTREETRRRTLKSAFQLDDIIVQYQAIRPQVANPALCTRMDELLDEAEEAASKGDPEATQKANATVMRFFEELKKSAGEMLVPLDEVLGWRGQPPLDDH